LYYFGARYYDSEIGRFITKDPDGGDATDPQSLNPYVYVRNNPVNLVDPDGRLVWATPVGVVVGVAIVAKAGYEGYQVYKGYLAWKTVVEKGRKISKSGKYMTEAERLKALTRTKEWKKFQKDFPTAAGILYSRSMTLGIRPSR
jgi:uncharacterized protein RhaS with RHS repeats